MTQPRISGSQRLTTSPVYFTWWASSSSTSFGSSMRVDVNCVLALRPSPRGCFSLPVIAVSPTVTSDDLAAAHERLELAVGDRLARRREEPRLHDGEQQEHAEHPPDGEGRTPAERPTLTGLAIARIDARV